MEITFKNEKYDASISILEANSNNEVELVIEETEISSYLFSSLKELDDFIEVAKIIRDRFAFKIGAEMRYESMGKV